MLPHVYEPDSLLHCGTCDAWAGASWREHRAHLALAHVSPASSTWAALPRALLRRGAAMAMPAALAEAVQLVTSSCDAPASHTRVFELLYPVVVACASETTPQQLELCYLCICMAIQQHGHACRDEWQPLLHAVIRRVDDFSVLDSAPADAGDAIAVAQQQQLMLASSTWYAAVTWMFHTDAPASTQLALATELVGAARKRAASVTVMRLCARALVAMVNIGARGAWQAVVAVGGLHDMARGAQAHCHAPRFLGEACRLAEAVNSECDSPLLRVQQCQQWVPLVLQLLQHGGRPAVPKVVRLGLQLWRCMPWHAHCAAGVPIERLVPLLLAAVCELGSEHPKVVWAALRAWASSSDQPAVTTGAVMKLVRAWALQLASANDSSNDSFDFPSISAAIVRAAEGAAADPEALAAAASLAVDVFGSASLLRRDFVRMVAACSDGAAAVLVEPAAVAPLVWLPPPLLATVLHDPHRRLCPPGGADPSVPLQLTELAAVVASFLDFSRLHLPSHRCTVTDVGFRGVVCDALHNCTWWPPAAVRLLARVPNYCVAGGDDEAHADDVAFSAALAKALCAHVGGPSSVTVAKLVKVVMACTPVPSTADGNRDAWEAVTAAMTAARHSVPFVHTACLRAVAVLARAGGAHVRAHKQQLTDCVLESLGRHGANADVRHEVERALVALIEAE